MYYTYFTIKLLSQAQTPIQTFQLICSIIYFFSPFRFLTGTPNSKCLKPVTPDTPS